MDLVEIWKSATIATKEQQAIANRIVADFTASGVTAEIRREGRRVTVWRDRQYEKRLIDDYVIG
jgi:hypothetical protein